MFEDGLQFHPRGQGEQRRHSIRRIKDGLVLASRGATLGRQYKYIRAEFVATSNGEADH